MGSRIQLRFSRHLLGHQVLIVWLLHLILRELGQLWLLGLIN